jgi:hypothetical protein
MERRNLTVTLLLVLSFPGAGQSQTPTGAIEGLVTDQSGASVVGAKVTITETATHRAIPLSTNELGRYSLRNLMPGLYSIRAEVPSFTTRLISDVQVDSGAVVTQDIRLEVGPTEQIVETTPMPPSPSLSRMRKWETSRPIIFFLCGSWMDHNPGPCSGQRRVQGSR